jgi:hypothetical protein
MWRARGHSAYCLANQSFFDEVALAGASIRSNFV